MDVLSASSLVASLGGAFISIAAFVLVSRLKSSGRTRRHLAYLALAATVVIVATSFASLRLVGLKSSNPGSVAVQVPTAPNGTADAPTTSTPVLVPRSHERVISVEHISEMLDAHDSLFGTTTREYIRRFEAKPGFRIVEAKFNEKSAARVSGFAIESTGQAATVRFVLTSGPAADRYRGWIDGELTLVQERIAD